MTKNDIVRQVSANSGLNLRRSQEAVETIFSQMASAMGRHEEVVLRGVGTWAVRHKRERMGKNPQTGEDAIVSARTVVQFKASEKWKKEVNDA